MSWRDRPLQSIQQLDNPWGDPPSSWLLRVDDAVVEATQAERVLDEYGRELTLTWGVNPKTGYADLQVAARTLSFWQRIQWVLRPKKLEVWQDYDQVRLT